MARRQFTREFKLEAVRLIQERGVSVVQAARDLEVGEGMLRRWAKEVLGDPQHVFPGQGQMKPEQLELERLRREVTKLKAERDILKKAAAPDIRPCRRDRRTNDVSRQLEFQTKQQPHTEPSPHLPPLTRRAAPENGRDKANERLDRRKGDHHGCRRLDAQGTVAAKATD